MTFTDEQIWEGLADPDFVVREEWAIKATLSAKHLRFLFEDTRFGSGFVLIRLTQRLDLPLSPTQEDLLFRLVPEAMCQRASFTPTLEQWRFLMEHDVASSGMLVTHGRLPPAYLREALISPSTALRSLAVSHLKDLSFEEQRALFDDSDDVVMALFQRTDFTPTEDELLTLSASLHDRFGVARSAPYFSLIEDMWPYWKGIKERPPSSQAESEELDWSLFLRPDTDDFDDF
jgi:hypothetical protein